MSKNNPSTFTFNFNFTLPVASNETNGGAALSSSAVFTADNKPTDSNPFGLPTTNETSPVFNFSTTNPTLTGSSQNTLPGQNFNFSFNFTMPTNSLSLPTVPPECFPINQSHPFSANRPYVNPFTSNGTQYLSNSFSNSKFQPSSACIPALNGNSFNNHSPNVFPTSVNNFNSASTSSGNLSNSFNQNALSSRPTSGPFSFSSFFNKPSDCFSEPKNTFPSGILFSNPSLLSDKPLNLNNPTQNSTPAALALPNLFNSPPSFFNKLNSNCKTNPLDIPLPANFEPIGSVIPFKPPTYPVLSERYNTITCMKDYDFYSQEEIRFQDYLSDRKGKQKDVLTIMKERSPIRSSELRFGSNLPSEPSVKMSAANDKTQSIFGNIENLINANSNEDRPIFGNIKLQLNSENNGNQHSLIRNEDQQNVSMKEGIGCDLNVSLTSSKLSVDSENFVVVPKETETAFVQLETNSILDEVIPTDDNNSKNDST